MLLPFFSIQIVYYLLLGKIMKSNFNNKSNNNNHSSHLKIFK